ncbi:MAG: polysaccharide pyruvyl transferase family protein [Gammaproteobacteria bacterium]|nr:polysaccharide pyruvyl transferase family protein [Gammaproteobacteria bacterium]
MQNNTARTDKPTLIGYLPPIGGIQKTRANYNWHSHLINSGDICYTYPGTLIACGNNYKAWNFSLTAEQVNEEYSNVIFYIPCRIAPPPHDKDGYPFERATEFVSKLKIPFVSVSESIQSSAYEYEADFHKKLSPVVTRYLHTLADRSVSIGTRGEFSAEVLKKLGIKNAEVVGCPSLYINGPQLNRKLTNLPEPGNIKNVAVCYSNYQELENSRIRDFLAMAKKRNYHYVEQSFNLIVKALHYPGMIEVNDILKAMSVFHGLDEIRDLFRHGRIRYFTNYQLWENFLRTMDFAFGARMHGLTPAIHVGVPAFFIAHDARVREMCEYFQLPYTGEADIPPGAEMEYFYSRCDYGDAVTSYPSRYY